MQEDMQDYLQNELRKRVSRFSAQVRMMDLREEAEEIYKKVGAKNINKLYQYIGEELGMCRTRFDIARRLRAAGMTPQQIHDFTDLSFYDIENL